MHRSVRIYDIQKFGELRSKSSYVQDLLASIEPHISKYEEIWEIKLSLLSAQASCIPTIPDTGDVCADVFSNEENIPYYFPRTRHFLKPRSNQVLVFPISFLCPLEIINSANTDQSISRFLFKITQRL